MREKLRELLVMERECEGVHPRSFWGREVTGGGGVCEGHQLKILVRYDFLRVEQLEG